MSSKVLVTGGAGFIGSAVVDVFLGAGFEVVVIDDLSSGKRQNLSPRAKLYEADIRSEAAVAAIVAERPEVICHHAAQIDVRKSMVDPRFDCDVNLGGLLNIMQGAVAAGSVAHVVFASSGGAMYGETSHLPTPETHPPSPVSHYGAAKAASELYLGVFRANHGISVSALRYANVYGPRQDPHGEAGVVAIFAGRLLAAKPCTVYGDGSQTRDYVFVGDVARANLLAVERRYDGALNIGTGVETCVTRLLDEVARAAGVTAEVVFGPARPGEQQRSCLDNTAARAALGFLPETSFAAGIERTVAWFRGA